MGEEERNGEIVKTSHPAKGVCNPYFIKKRTNQEYIITRGEPDAQWLSMKQPVTVDFCQAGIHINDRDKSANDIDCPKRHNITFDSIIPSRIQREVNIRRKEY